MDPLAGLRDIHPPPPVPWWPPAPGWWVLLVLLVIALAVVGYRYYRRQAPARAALRELGRLAEEYRGRPEPGILAAGLSRLVRRLALVGYPKERVAGLTGEAWLGFLDRTLDDGRQFRDGPGRVLITAPYRRTPDLDGVALLALVEQWVAKQKISRNTSHISGK